jgi:hypothetical protein
MHRRRPRAPAMTRVDWSEEVRMAIQAAVAPLAGEAPVGESIEIKMRVTTEGSRIWFTMRLDGECLSVVGAWTD